MFFRRLLCIHWNIHWFRRHILELLRAVERNNKSKRAQRESGGRSCIASWVTAQPNDKGHLTFSYIACPTITMACSRVSHFSEIGCSVWFVTRDLSKALPLPISHTRRGGEPRMLILLSKSNPLDKVVDSEDTNLIQDQSNSRGFFFWMLRLVWMSWTFGAPVWVTGMSDNAVQLMSDNAFLLCVDKIHSFKTYMKMNAVYVTVDPPRRSWDFLGTVGVGYGDTTTTVAAYPILMADLDGLPRCIGGISIVMCNWISTLKLSLSRYVLSPRYSFHGQRPFHCQRQKWEKAEAGRRPRQKAHGEFKLAQARVELVAQHNSCKKRCQGAQSKCRVRNDGVEGICIKARVIALQIFYEAIDSHILE